jgi:hypothetical protein
MSVTRRIAPSRLRLALAAMLALGVRSSGSS